MKILIIAVSFSCIAAFVSSNPLNSSCDHLGPMKFSYKDVKTKEEALKFGCNVKCRLTEVGVFKQGVILNEIVDSDFKELGVVNECNRMIPKDIDEQDCSHFYDFWKCLERLRDPWSNVENIEDIEETCGKVEECGGQCFYEELGMLRDGILTIENVPTDLAPEYRKFIVKSLKICIEKLNGNYEEGDRFKCRYFEDLDSCLKKQVSIF